MCSLSPASICDYGLSPHLVHTPPFFPFLLPPTPLCALSATETWPFSSSNLDESTGLQRIPCKGPTNANQHDATDMACLFRRLNIVVRGAICGSGSTPRSAARRNSPGAERFADCICTTTHDKHIGTTEVGNPREESTCSASRLDEIALPIRFMLPKRLSLET